MALVQDIWMPESLGDYDPAVARSFHLRHVTSPLPTLSAVPNALGS